MGLDLWQGDANTAIASAARTSAPRLPATFEDTFEPAWRRAELFTQSIAGHNARLSALDDALADVKKRTGTDLMSEIDPEYPDFDQLNAAIRARRAKDPNFASNEYSEDQISQAAVAKSRQAVEDYAALQRREQTAGGRFGTILGGLAGAAADPVNVLALPAAAPEGLGILATMGIWSAIGAGTQAVGEVIGSPFREEVQPGYLESGEPFKNVLEVGLFAGGTAGIIKGAGAMWTRVATGAWPRSVRDAGNVVASEANVQHTNVLPGTAGEVAHREALTKTIDDVLAGRAVDVDDIFARSRTLIGRLESETGLSLPIFDRRAIELLSEDARLADHSGVLASQLEALPEGIQASADRLARVREVERQMVGVMGEERRALAQRRDELLADTTPERLAAEARPLELRRAAEAERESITARRDAIAAELAQKRSEGLVPNQPLLGQRMVVRNGTLFEAYQARIDAVLGEARAAAREVEQGRAERAAATTARAPELPFQAGAAEARAEVHVATVADGVQRLAATSGYAMPREEAQRIAQMVADAKSDEHARAILSEVSTRPRTVADYPPTAPGAGRAARAEPAIPAPELDPQAIAKTLAAPQHTEALLADLDRLRMNKDRNIPVGVDANGEPVYRSLDAMMEEVRADQQAAAHLEGCLNPPQQGAEAA